MVESLFVPRNMSIEQMWEAIQVNKETINDWVLLEDPVLIEDHILKWTKLHHHQANDSPSLHSDYGVSQSPCHVPGT